MKKFQRPVFEIGRRFVERQDTETSTLGENLEDVEILKTLKSGTDHEAVREAIFLARERGIGIRELTDRLEDHEELLRSEARSYWLKSALEYLAISGDSNGIVAVESLGEFPELAPIVGFALSEVRRESARPILRLVVRREAEESVLRSHAAALLRNVFGDSEGLDYFEKGLASSDASVFDTAFSAYYQVHGFTRDEEFVGRVGRAMNEQKSTDFLATLLHLPGNSGETLALSVSTVAPFLSDRRKATHRLLPRRSGELRDFAAFYLDCLLAHESAFGSFHFQPVVRHLKRLFVRRRIRKSAL